MPPAGPVRADSRVRTERGERSREAILNAALALFSERGYDAVAIVEIAERAGLSKSVIYDHFASKAELHRALLEREAEALLTHLAAAVPAPDAASASQRLRAGADAFFRYAEEQPLAWRLLIRDAPTEPGLAAAHREIQRRGTEAVALLIGGPGLVEPAKRRHKEMLAELLKSSITGLAAWWLDHPEVSRGQLVDAVIEFAWFGLQQQSGDDPREA